MPVVINETDTGQASKRRSSVIGQPLRKLFGLAGKNLKAKEIDASDSISPPAGLANANTQCREAITQV
jgi:hypothetical protein